MSLMFRQEPFPVTVPFTIVIDAEYIWDERLGILKGTHVAKLQGLKQYPNPVLLYLVTSNKKLLESGKLLAESGMRMSLIDVSYWTDSDIVELVSTSTFVYTPFNTKVFKLTPSYLKAQCVSHDAFIDAVSIFVSGHLILDNQTRKAYLL